MDFPNRPRMSMKNSVPLTRNEINSITSSSFGVEKSIGFKAPSSCKPECIRHFEDVSLDMLDIVKENIFEYNSKKIIKEKVLCGLLKI